MQSWSEFRTGREEGILPLSDIVAIMSTPRHRAKLTANYMSSAAEYAALFFRKLKEVTGSSPFWNPNPVLSGVQSERSNSLPNS